MIFLAEAASIERTGFMSEVKGYSLSALLDFSALASTAIGVVPDLLDLYLGDYTRYGLNLYSLRFRKIL